MSNPITFYVISCYCCVIRTWDNEETILILWKLNNNVVKIIDMENNDLTERWQCHDDRWHAHAQWDCLNSVLPVLSVSSPGVSCQYHPPLETLEQTGDHDTDSGVGTGNNQSPGHWSLSWVSLTQQKQTQSLWYTCWHVSNTRDCDQWHWWHVSRVETSTSTRGEWLTSSQQWQVLCQSTLSLMTF